MGICAVLVIDFAFLFIARITMRDLLAGDKNPAVVVVTTLPRPGSVVPAMPWLRRGNRRRRVS
jgi:hypothetical protein